MSGAPGLLLDIDGTVLDSTYHQAMAWLRALRRSGHETTAARAHRAIGLGGDHLVPHLLGCAPGEVAPELFGELTTAHAEELARLTDEVRALPGARELVLDAAGRGVRVVLASSGTAANLGWMIPRIGDGVAEALHGWTTSEDAAATKPAPDVLQVAMDTHGLDPERSIMIGDSTWDGEAAGRAGVRFVGVLSGGLSADELVGAGAREVHADPAGLLAAKDSLVHRLVAPDS